MAAVSSGIESPHAPIRGRARVLANEVDGNGRKLTLAVPDWPGAIPGQFLMIGAGAEAGVPRRDPLLPRPMAVYRELGAVEGEPARRIQVLYRVVGRGTTLLAETEPGQSISLVGPLGRGFPIEGPGDAVDDLGPALLVGGGTGIASLFELARALSSVGRQVIVILGARSAPDLIGKTDFEALDVELVCTTEDGSEGLHGRVTDPLAEWLSAPPGAVGRPPNGGASGSAPASGFRQATVFAVGPTPMMKACAALAATHSAPCFVSLENPMACGFGVCLGCAAPRAEGGFSLVCRAGPVFEASEIDWEGLP